MAIRLKRSSERNDGLVAGNAMLSADVTARGALFKRVIYNPPCFNDGENALKDAGFCALKLDGRADYTLEWHVIEHTYPRYRAESNLPNGMRLCLTAFAPLGVTEYENIFLPVINIEVEADNPGADECVCPVSFCWNLGKLPIADIAAFEDGCVRRGDAFLFADGLNCLRAEDVENGVGLSGHISVPARGTVRARLTFGVFESAARWRAKLCGLPELIKYLRANAERISEDTDKFIRLVPDAGDEKLREYTRWYLQAAVLLTKSAITGEVITMGYNEFNQRDSFWTSFLHLSLWPELERDMLRAAVLWQRPDGKIPTTILPRIEREHDIDINEYFILRVARYYKRHHDIHFLRACYPACKLAARYLMGRDTDKDGLPEQLPGDDPGAFWADWKDVRGVQGRKLAPHFCLLWLAVLKESRQLADALDDQAFARECEAWYDRAYEVVNRDFADGGMWDKDHYCEAWYDGRYSPCVLQDQAVGAYFGVIPKKRAQALWEALSRGECDCGIRETWPYRADDFGYAPGEYHNGGVWPYLMFADAMGRCRYGHADEAERLIRRLGYFDLEKTDHWAPNEYLNGETGENRGFEVQGWSAALYGVLTDGLFRQEYENENTICVRVCFRGRDFDTLLALPERFGIAHVRRENGILSVSQPQNPALRVTVREDFAGDEGD